VTDKLIREVATALRACAVWHGTPDVVIRYSDPPKVASLLQQAIARH